jgi:hypothetical protein
MCGIQIGREQLKSILAHSERTADASQAACGLQVGREELSSIVAHGQASAGASARAPCGVQIGYTE